MASMKKTFSISCWICDITNAQGTYIIMIEVKKNYGIRISYQHHEEYQKTVHEKNCKHRFTYDVL